jgi:hypothetical protein
MAITVEFVPEKIFKIVRCEKNVNIGFLRFSK